MAIITDTYLTYSSKGNREGLSDVIYRISPEETPLMSNAGKASGSSTYFEWQNDALASAAANGVVEGNEAAYVAAVATTRLGNYHQISTKTALVSGTLDAINKAGRKSEMAYQMAKKSAELKRDMEFTATRNAAAVAGSSSVARLSAGLESFLRTNDSRGATGADPTLSGTTEGFPNAAPTDGTPRAFTETLLKAVLLASYNSGGKGTMLMVGPAQKQVVSSFAGIAVNRFNVQGAKQGTIIGAADVYVSDFGVVNVVPNRFQRNASAFVLDVEHIEISYLRPFQAIELARSGDAEKKLILVEWGLKVHHEAAHGIVADLT